MEGFCGELPQVPAGTNSQLNWPLRGVHGLQAALQSMQGQRAPKVDGLTVDVCKTF